MIAVDYVEGGDGEESFGYAGGERFEVETAVLAYSRASKGSRVVTGEG
ncbi:hypothetical protein PJI16_10215 [Nitrospira sp. MA-1]|nr:hypothetical protein [Nitrospira sp. MA-1]